MTVVLIAGLYVAPCMAMNHGFVVMSWKHSRSNGVIMLALPGIQLVTNALSHRR